MVAVVTAFLFPMVAAPATLVVLSVASMAVVETVMRATVVVPIMFSVVIVVAMARRMAICILRRTIMMIEIMGLGGTHARAKQREAGQRRGQAGEPA